MALVIFSLNYATNPTQKKSQVRKWRGTHSPFRICHESPHVVTEAPSPVDPAPLS